MNSKNIIFLLLFFSIGCIILLIISLSMTSCALREFYIKGEFTESGMELEELDSHHADLEPFSHPSVIIMPNPLNKHSLFSPEALEWC